MATALLFDVMFLPKIKQDSAKFICNGLSRVSNDCGHLQFLSIALGKDAILYHRPINLLKSMSLANYKSAFG